jgi:hypothetical protein
LASLLLILTRLWRDIREPLDAVHFGIKRVEWPSTMPEFEVAVSFKSVDEPFALSIKSGIDPPLRTFVYSRAQDRLIGQDGIDAFSKAFKVDCRLAVVLYRQGWGTDGFTRAEEQAIKARCFDGDGWGHLMVVRMDRSPLPTWLDLPTKLYYDPAAVPFTDLLAAIRIRCAELGAELRPPSAAELARAQVQQEKFDADTEHQLRMATAFLPVYAELGAVLMAKAKEVGEASGRGIVTGPGQMGSFIVFDTHVTLQVARPMYLPSHLEEAVLTVSLVQGRLLTLPELQGGMRVAFGTRPIDDWPLSLRRVPGTGWCWEMRGKTMPPAEIADALLSALLEARQRTSRGPVL